MAEQRTSPALSRLLAWLPYALPVLGGVIGVAFVNLQPAAFINPVLAIAVGAVAGWIVSVLVRKGAGH